MNSSTNNLLPILVFLRKTQENNSSIGTPLALSQPDPLDVTGSWDKASLFALWTGVSSGTGLFRDVVVASTVSMCVSGLCFRTHVSWTSSDGQRGWNAVESVVSASYFVA
jgi:hypothetical protein